MSSIDRAAQEQAAPDRYRLRERPYQSVPETVDSILNFWFEDSLEAVANLDAHVSRWFCADSAYDRYIEQRFGRAVVLARSNRLNRWRSTARQQLALIILLDQLPRNIFRGKPEAYASDEKSRLICTEGLESRSDRSLAPIERNFYYMPLLHSENIEDQDRSVACYTQLLEDVGAHHRQHFLGCKSAARRYRDVIARFGRFPHRNVIFGRESTPEELSLIQSGGY